MHGAAPQLSVLACMGVRDQQLFGNILGWTTNVWGHQVRAPCGARWQRTGSLLAS